MIKELFMRTPLHRLEFEMIRKLHKIASVQVRAYGVIDNMNWCGRVNEDGYALPVYELALKVSGQSSLAYENVLPVLVESDALLVLRAMPNLYWFWRVVMEASVYQLEEHSKLTKSNVLKAIGSIRHIGSLNQVIGDYRRGVALNPQTTAYLVASGALLSDASTLAIIENPVYFKDFTAEPFRFDC